MIRLSGIVIYLSVIVHLLAGSCARAEGFFSQGPMATPADASYLSGIKIFSHDPLRFRFIVNKQVSGNEEAMLLIKYFFAALTIPGQDIWVNLQPDEHDRIMPQTLARTGLGRDLLAQDYVLKHMMADALNPRGETGKAFWKELYTRAAAMYGTTDIPLDILNRVWIIPQSAGVYEDKTSGMAFVRSARLKVMLEGAADGLTQEILRTLVIPVLQERVDIGEEFIPLRRIYTALILAAWYKQRMIAGRLSREYVDRGKVTGIAIDDPGMADRIWQQYVRIFEKGAFDLVREEQDISTGVAVVRRYFSGGMTFDMAQLALRKEGAPDQSELSRLVNDALVLDVILQPINAASEQRADRAMSASQAGQAGVAGYKVLRLIQDRGRFAVYLVEKDGKMFILKTPSASSDRQNVLEQLLANEAGVLKDITLKSSASGSEGPVVRFVDYFHDQKRSYLVTEYIEGQTFGEYLYAHADMGLTQRLRLLRALFGAVAELHQAGYVSCDIKPDNIMIDSQRRVRIIDLDMAVRLDSLRTPDDLVTGVPVYVPPEDSPGSVDVPQRWSAVRDIYALGVLLMNTALSPLREGERGPVPVFRLWLDTRVETRDREDVFLRIKAIVRKALAEKPRQRYQSISEMTADLERLLQRVSHNGRIDPGGVDLAGIERRLDIVRAAEGFNTIPAFSPESYQESAGYAPVLLHIFPLQHFVEQLRNQY